MVYIFTAKKSMKKRQCTTYFVTVNYNCSLPSGKKNLLTEAHLSPDLRTQNQFGRLKDPTLCLLATPVLEGTVLLTLGTSVSVFIGKKMSQV